ncbi:COG1361 S-layer family protein [Nitrosopumilus sp.]|uniref:COG1361 S-layer family protein n=1 Tax=Nitrosopumilus sp. TaxID=2024843 RepID=UPI003D10A632
MFTTKMHLKDIVLKLFTIVSFLIILSLPIYAHAQASDCLSTTNTRVDSDYNGPVFLDAYWTDRSESSTDELNPLELEVGPGEGQSTLAVVFVNRSSLELYAITGYLRLPTGFEPGGTSADPQAKSYFASSHSRITGDVSQASYFDELEEGEVFTLYFDVDITDDASVGSYLSSAILDYSTAEHVRSCKSALLNVPFILPGKVILDLSTDNKPLTPKVPNSIDFIISNKGSSPATGAVLTILSIGDDNNRSSRDSSSSTVTLESSDTELVNLGENTFNIGKIPANGSTKISTIIFPEATAASTVQNISLQITYGNAYGYKQTELLTTGLVVSPKPSESPIIVSVDTQHDQPVVTAGIVENILFQVANNGEDEITDLLLTLTGETTEMKIMGKSKWMISSLPIGETYEFTTDVFASTSLINSPSSFSMDLDYISDGESSIDTANVGVFVSGSIELTLYDIQVNSIGGKLHLVGNVLNQGSTTGKFANISLLSLAEIPNVSDTSPQYIGDLTDDSSIPFSIPLPVSSISEGKYPFSVKVTYADDLRNFHEIVFDDVVNVSQIREQISNERDGGNTDLVPVEVLLIIVVAVVIGSIIAFSIRKNRKQVSSSDDDLDFLLDDSKSSKH